MIKMKVVKEILVLILVVLLGTGAYAVISQKNKNQDNNVVENETTISGIQDNNKIEIVPSNQTEENAENQEGENTVDFESQENGYEESEEDGPPIDDYVEKLSTIDSKGATKESGEMAISGVKLNMTREEVEKLIGKPQKMNDSESDSAVVTVFYGEDEDTSPLIQYFKENGEYKVYTMTVPNQDSKFQSDRGIRVGDTFEKLISKYAKDENVEAYDKSPNVFVLYGKDDIGYNDDEYVMYPKSSKSQLATMYGFYDNGKDDIKLLVSYSYGDKNINYILKDGVVESMTIMPWIY